MKAIVSLEEKGERTGRECVFWIGDGEKTYEGVVARVRTLLELDAAVPLVLRDTASAQPVADTSAWAAACGRAVRASAARDPQRAFQDAVVRLSVEIATTSTTTTTSTTSTATTKFEPEIDEDLNRVAEASVAARSPNRVVQNSIAALTAEPGSTALRAAKTVALALLPGAVKALAGGVGAAAAAGAFFAHSRQRPFGVAAGAPTSPAAVRDALVRLSLLGDAGTSTGSSTTGTTTGKGEVLAGDPFWFVVGDEAALRAAADTAGLGACPHLTYDELAGGATYAFRTPVARACKRAERGSWAVGCAPRAEREALAALSPRVALRTYRYAPQDAVSTQLLSLTTAETLSSSQRDKRDKQQRKQQRKPKRFTVRKNVYWLADVPQGGVRIAVLTVDHAQLDARREAAMALVLEQMRAMGFTDDARCRRALARHNGDINAAVQDLL